MLVFGEVIDKGGTPYTADMRGVLKGYAQGLHDKHGYTLNAANEIEGFIFSGVDAEKRAVGVPAIGPSRAVGHVQRLDPAGSVPPVTGPAAPRLRRRCH